MEGPADQQCQAFAKGCPAPRAGACGSGTKIEGTGTVWTQDPPLVQRLQPANLLHLARCCIEFCVTPFTIDTLKPSISFPLVIVHSDNRTLLASTVKGLRTTG